MNGTAGLVPIEGIGRLTRQYIDGGDAMPALQPPSMQIGGLLSGQSTLSSGTPGPTGAALVTRPTAVPTLVQQVAAATTVVTPASLTVTIAATGAGNMLVAGCAVASTGALSVFTTPTNWTSVAATSGHNAANTLSGSCFFFPANPGGITSVVFAVTNANGIAAWVGEFTPGTAFVGVGSETSATGSSYANTTTIPLIQYSPVTGAALVFAFETDVTGAVYTPSNVGAGWVTGTTATSTTGATLCVIRPFFAFVAPGRTPFYQIFGTLGASIAAGNSLLAIDTSAGSQLRTGSSSGIDVDQGAGYSTSELGVFGWATGGSKPGGEGGGQ